jgi:hypothetical protein
VSYEILFTEEHHEQILDNFDNSVLESLKERLDKKQELLNQVDRRDQACKRFHKVFTAGGSGVPIAEMRFRANGNKKYRGVFVLVDRAESFVFVQVVEKENSYQRSKQEELVEAIGKNPKEVMDYARDVVVQEMDY